MCCLWGFGVWNFAPFCLIVVRALGSIEKGRSKTSLLSLLLLISLGGNTKYVQQEIT